jgi:O-antigen ligase
LRATLKAYIFIAAVVSIYGIYQFFAVKFGLPFVDITNAVSTTGSGLGVNHYIEAELFRSHSTFQEPLDFGHYILSIFPIMLFLYIFKKNPGKNGLLVKSNIFLIIIMAIALLLTKSGGAFVGFAVASASIFFLLEPRLKLKLIGLAVFAVIIFSILILPFISSQYHNIGEFITYRFSAEQRQPRLDPIPYMIGLWSQYPILGVGIGNYGLYAADYYSRDVVQGALGIYQQSLLETGIIGFSALILLLFVYFKTMVSAILKFNKTYWYPYFLGFLTSFIALSVQYLTFGDRFNMYFWVFLGISMAAVKLAQEERSSGVSLERPLAGAVMAPTK